MEGIWRLVKDEILNVKVQIRHQENEVGDVESHSIATGYVAQWSEVSFNKLSKGLRTIV